MKILSPGFSIIDLEYCRKGLKRALAYNRSGGAGFYQEQRG
jgi:hypothetical protein